MVDISLSNADRYFPLIASSPQSSGGSICLQNILDLNENGTLDALRHLQGEIARNCCQSQLLNDALIQEPQLSYFFQFVDTMYAVAHAWRVRDLGHALTIQQDGGNITFAAENFYLNPIKASLTHIQERYGRLVLAGAGDKNEGIGGVERIIATTKWILMKNHFNDYLMTFDVSRADGSNDIVLKVHQWEGDNVIPEIERKLRLSELEGFLIACCHPGRLGVFPAAIVQLKHEKNRRNGYIRVTPTGSGNPGVEALEQVLSRQAMPSTEMDTIFNDSQIDA